MLSLVPVISAVARQRKRAKFLGRYSADF